MYRMNFLKYTVMKYWLRFNTTFNTSYNKDKYVLENIIYRNWEHINKNETMYCILLFSESVAYLGRLKAFL